MDYKRVLILHFTNGMSSREISETTGDGKTTVKIVTMHILVEMEEMTFYSLDELNAELWKRMEQENRENFQGLSYQQFAAVLLLTFLLLL